MKRAAKFWELLEDKKVQCHLCAHNCKIKAGSVGVCGVRKNEGGRLFTLIYSSCSSVAADPIEKKPLFHFHPGTSALSLGTVGCNFKCDHCQNASISTADLNYRYVREIPPEHIVGLAKEQCCEGVAWTYNEPSIWHEYSLDASRLAKKEGLYTCYVSNGYISEDPLRELAPFLDAINVDVKAFNEQFYKKICKARLSPVLETCERCIELGIHLEITYLVIPGLNDSLDEVQEFCKWVVESLKPEVAVHFTRFHPDHQMTNVPRTPIKKLEKIYEIAKEVGILYPYLGNISNGKYENTVCPKCGSMVIERHGFSVDLSGFKDGKCVSCGTLISVVY